MPVLKKNIKKKKKRKKEKRSTTLKHKKLINHVYFTTRHCHANSLPNPGHQHTTTESEHFKFFYRLTVGLSLEKGAYPGNSHVVYRHIK